MHDDPEQPSLVAPNEPTSATGVLRALADGGYGTAFMPGGGPGIIRCGACRTESPAGAFAIHEERRLEGVSDPDDMVLVVAAICPACTARGAIVLAYGPEASDTDSDIVVALDQPTTD